MFNPRLVKNFNEVDAHNRKMFDKYEVSNPDELRHVCVVCGDMTCIEDSMSSAGHNLVCSSCYTNHEDHSLIEGVIEWVCNFDGHEG